MTVLNLFLVLVSLFFSPASGQNLNTGQTVKTGQTVLDGVYTREQAVRGEKVYDAQCIKCHEGNDPDGPPLFGRSFIERWREDDIEDLYTFIYDRMPADSPGKLSDDEYLDVLTYLLRANSYAEGAKPLTFEALPEIMLVGPDGPKPLPSNSLVQSVGCLTQASPEEWTLTRATSPVRSRRGKENTPEELKRSAARALGSETFALRNFTNVNGTFKPEPLKDHKVQVKGVLIRPAGAGERISLTPLESLSSTCGQ